MENAPKEAVQLYYAIFEAYLDVGTELIGENVIEEQIVPRMKYYIDAFLPEMGLTTDEATLFLLDFKDFLEKAIFDDTETITYEDVWKLRAIIFGFENAFLEILGEGAVKKYVLSKIGDYLVSYLPEIFASQGLSLQEKLDVYLDFLKKNKFIKAGKVKEKQGQIQFSSNHCIFAAIHDSVAYRDGKTRFCPWGMIATAIAFNHFQINTSRLETTFTYRGSITNINLKESQT